MLKNKTKKILKFSIVKVFHPYLKNMAIYSFLPAKQSNNSILNSYPFKKRQTSFLALARFKPSS